MRLITSMWRAVGKIWAWVWVLPLALPGLLLWLWVRLAAGRQFAFRAKVQGQHVYIVHGVLCRDLLRLYPWFEVDALAVGWVILAPDEANLKRCLAHELVHVRQAMRWGLLFPVLYLGSSLWAWLSGLDPYHGNVFERAALEAEKCTTSLP